MNPNRLPLLMFVLAGLVVIAVIGMSTGSWVFFGVALAMHAIASFFVVRGAVRGAQTGSESNAESERLDDLAGEAVPDGQPRYVETEIEALKREPARR